MVDVDDHPRPRPLARVVEEVAEHLVEILALAAEGVIRRYLHVDREAPAGVEALERAGQTLARLEDRRARARRRARRRRARMREVVVDLPLHAVDLLGDPVRQLRSAGTLEALAPRCERIASGVFRPCARSPALPIARADRLIVVLAAAR